MNLEDESIYHEKQKFELCCLHVLNNLFQGHAFTKATLDGICHSLSPDSYSFWNPHRSCLGLGSYDVNVLIAALQCKDCSAIWFDRRKNPHCLNLNKVVGFVLNVPGSLQIPFMKRRHWFAIKELGGAYFNLDSKLEQPKFIGNDEHLFSYLIEKLKHPETQLFVVVSIQSSNDGSYLNL